MTLPPAPCRAREILGRIGGKWSLDLLAQLGSGPRRFTELRRAVGGISHRVLTATLRDLERDGLVSRTVFAVMPPRVDYALTPAGKALLERLGDVVSWAEHHAGELDAARAGFDGRHPS
ncbi:helix-turn-helix transcriptional regulator [Nonomuraea sp. NBC_01738]|uniref:winged helix-turn-helix transcriptional regulator n=1 Tax=Nonomuraea sp. NBC_01738 TaxID=2976003 RepID=UPI002E132312|nr:helix-turn-helix transcriptional regulator [Nonomuraea sp. NBC_01738]